MAAIRTVLCPVDFSPSTPRQIELAAELCRLFGARLVLHHNLAAAATAAGVGWMWAASHPNGHSEAEVERRLRELLAAVPDGLASEARTTRGLPSQAVLAVQQATAADLVVLTTHGASTEEHTSIAAQILERASCAVLVLHELAVEGAAPHFDAGERAVQVVLVPTDLSAESLAAVRFAFELARVLPAELHLLHVAPAARHAGAAAAALAAESERKLRALVPEDLEYRVHHHVEPGDPATAIARAAERLHAAYIVMGEHTRSPLRRWLTRDVSRDVLHRAPCPIWYVPGATAA